MTQARFARHWGVRLSTVGRWESSRPPTGLNLERLALLAENRGLASVAATFRKALEGERGAVVPFSVGLNSEEAMYVIAVLDVLRGRDPALARLRPALARLLEPAIRARPSARRPEPEAFARDGKSMDQSPGSHE